MRVLGHSGPAPSKGISCSSMKRSLVILLACALAGSAAWLLTMCLPVNVLGRSVPDSEYKALYDSEIAREKSGLQPGGASDEQGRAPSWNEFWRTVGGTNPVPPTTQSLRLKRYIIEQRRAAGLPELTGQAS